MMRGSQASELLELIDPRLDKVSSTRVTGSIAADERHHQPWGVVYGGCYTAAFETFVAIGAYEAIKDGRQQTVGVHTAGEFLTPHRTGRLDVEAIAVEQARAQQLWQVQISGPEHGNVIRRGPVRLQIIEARECS